MNKKYNPAINEEVPVKRKWKRKKIVIDWKKYNNKDKQKLGELLRIVREYRDAKHLGRV